MEANDTRDDRYVKILYNLCMTTKFYVARNLEKVNVLV